MRSLSLRCQECCENPIDTDNRVGLCEYCYDDLYSTCELCEELFEEELLTEHGTCQECETETYEEDL